MNARVSASKLMPGLSCPGEEEMDTENKNRSEVARLMQQIRLEYEAAQRGLTELAIVSNHAFITARMEAILAYQVALLEQVGPEEAAKLLDTLE